MDILGPSNKQMIKFQLTKWKPRAYGDTQYVCLKKLQSQDIKGTLFVFAPWAHPPVTLRQEMTSPSSITVPVTLLAPLSSKTETQYAHITVYWQK